MSAAQMQSLSEISGALDAGNVTSEALVQAHLARIADLSDGLNCFVEVEADRALSRARAMDAERRAGYIRGAPARHSARSQGHVS